MKGMHMIRIGRAFALVSALVAVAAPSSAQALPARAHRHRPPDAVRIVTSLLEKNGATAIIDPSTRPPTLSIQALSVFPRSDRRRVTQLVQHRQLRVRHSGAITALSAPELPDDTAPGVPATATTSSSSYPGPNIGGVRFYFGTISALYGCTSGFPVANGFGYFTATAGHCGPQVSTQVWSANAEPWATTISPYDHTRLSKWGTSGAIPADVSMFSIPSTLPVIRVSATQNRVIKGGEDPSLLEGDVCFRGATSASERCGNVSDVNLVSVVEGRQFPAFCIYKLAANGGDSGAPIYKRVGTDQARIRGIVSFVWDSDGDGVKDKTCGSQVSSVLSATSSSLVTG